jgi:DNA-binding response OmpR family regulator
MDLSLSFRGFAHKVRSQLLAVFVPLGSSLVSIFLLDVQVTSQKPYRVLLVDDEPGIRKILKLFLELEGYSVYEAITANQAISVIKKEKPHLVILDVILCGQTGFDVCEWIKNNPETKDVIVFLFTALNQEHDYREGQRVGCDLYLTKPQNPKDIVEKVTEFLLSKNDCKPDPEQCHL